MSHQGYIKQVVFLILLISGLLNPASFAYGAEIKELNVKINGEEVVVSTSVELDEAFINEARNGIQKELLFYIDLFRVWKGWADEYVTGNFIERKIIGDVIKGEYILSSFDRNRKVIVERRFRSFESMIKWMTEIRDLPLMNIKGIEPGDYYVRITVESRLRRLPPVLSYLLFFIPEKEFSISKDSIPFKIETK
jgi:hypothetical protein